MRKLPRVWDKVTKEMMLPARWEEDYVGCGHKKIGLYIYRSRKNVIDHSSLDWVLRHPEYFDVMWPTGLKDKNDKELYKGELLKSRFFSAILVVDQLTEGSFCGQWIAKAEDGGYQDLHEAITVDNYISCGNVHTTPELLEGKD